MDYSTNKKYFKESGFPVGAIVVGIVGLLAFLGGTAGVLIGLVLLGAAAWWIYAKIGGRPLDSHIDQQIQSELSQLIPQGLKKLGLDGDEVKVLPPLLFSGPESGAVGSAQPWFKVGKDGQFRCSNVRAVTLFFSEQQVYVYTFKFSLVESASMELTDEYFYRDIVSVATGSETFNWNVGKKSAPRSRQMETFRLTVSGASIEVALADNSSAAQSIQGMKQLIREKKNV